MLTPLHKNMKVVKATITVGTIDLEVYQLPDGEYRLSKGQVTKTVGLNHQRYAQILGSKEAQTLYTQALRDAQILKVSDAESGKQVQLVQIEQAIIVWDISDTDVGKALVRALAIESLERRADAAFGKVRSEEERNALISQRLTHRKDFHTKYTSWLKQDGVTTTYGTEVNQLKIFANLPLKPVSEYNEEELRKLNEKETEYNFARKLGMSHSKALLMLA